jgi:hypothetical protein
VSLGRNSAIAVKLIRLDRGVAGPKSVIACSGGLRLSQTRKIVCEK